MRDRREGIEDAAGEFPGNPTQAHPAPPGGGRGARIQVTPTHRELLGQLTPEDRETVAGWLHPSFPPERVSALSLASLPRFRVELLETRVRNRKRWSVRP